MIITTTKLYCDICKEEKPYSSLKSVHDKQIFDLPSTDEVEGPPVTIRFEVTGFVRNVGAAGETHICIDCFFLALSSAVNKKPLIWRYDGGIHGFKSVKKKIEYEVID